MIPLRKSQIASAITVLLASCTADAFGVTQSHFTFNNGHAAINTHRRHAQTLSAFTRTSHLYQSSNDDFIDKREGMADAFSALNSLSSLDDSTDNVSDDELKAELFADMMGDLSDVDMNVDDVVADFQQQNIEAPNVEDVDGIGSISDSEPVLTTGDFSNEILDQDLGEAMNVDNFMSNALESAMADLGKKGLSNSGYAAEIAKSVIQDEDFKKEIGAIFDKAAEEMRADIEAMRKEEVRGDNCYSHCGFLYISNIVAH